MFGHDDTTNSINPLVASEPKADGMLGHADTVAADLAADLAATTPQGSPVVQGSSVNPAAPLPQVKTASSNGATATGRTNVGDDELLNIKQQALQQLTPLVGHLDQTAEEKFRTTMMMIQAADNKSLLKDAYEAAQAITDEKVRAQALLDVVNEINYFTQQEDSAA